MKQFALVALALVLSQSSVRAAEAPRVFTAEMKLHNTDARTMFSAMSAFASVGTDELGPFMRKTQKIGDISYGGQLTVACELISGGDLATCDLTWLTSVELQAGKTTELPEAFSQALVSGLGLLQRPRLGSDWTGLSWSNTELTCRSVYTPTDLPIYTACRLELSAH